MDRAARARAIAAHTERFAPPLTPELTLHLAREVVPIWEAMEAAEGRGPLPAPFWAFAWAGGQALARYVLDRPEVVRGKRVLDFASGCGVSALAAARAGAGSVLASEIDPWAVAAVELNARAAGLAVEVTGDDLVGQDQGWEVVLAGDVLYRAEAAGAIVGWLRGLAGRGAQVLVGDPGRAFLPARGLRELARYEVVTTVDLEGVSSRRPAVYALEPS